MHDLTPKPYDESGYRYTTLAFPLYRHLPGVTPHPERDPKGHSFGKRQEAPTTFDPDRWRNNERYLYGVDLYNFAYYWEAHEAWEGLWKTTGRTDMPGTFLQGLIQVAAALLKREQREATGMQRLSKAGLNRLRRVADARPVYCGVDISEFSARLDEIFLANDASGWPADPRIRLEGIRTV